MDNGSLVQQRSLTKCPPPVKLLFVGNGSHKRSQYEHEVIDSQRRSHAARVSWKGRTERDKGRKARMWTLNEITERPSPVLIAGNSDPFSALAIEVTPQINRMITFLRDAIIPALYWTPFFRACSPEPSDTIDVVHQSKGSIISRHSAYREWMTTVNNLRDEGCAYAALAVYRDHLPCHGYASDTASKLPSALALRTHSMHLLQATIRNDAEGRFVDTERAMQHVLLLFRAELAASNHDAGMIHGAMLRHMVEKARLENRLTIPFLVNCIAADADHAVKLMTRTILDFDGWCWKIFVPIWQQTYSYLPPIPSAIQDGLSPTVDIEPLRSALVAMRSQLHSGLNPDRSFQYSNCNPDILIPVLATRAYLDMGRLMNLYLDLADSTRSINFLLTPGRRYTQAGLILTMIFMVRSWGIPAFVNGENIKDASPIIMAQLQPCAQRMLKLCTPQERLHYHDAHFWILYGGAVWELQQVLTNFTSPRRWDCIGTDIVASDKKWFTYRLTNFCWEHGIVTLSQLLGIESKFMQTDLLEPHPSTWFEQMFLARS